MRASSSSRDFFHLGSSALALGLALGQAMSAGAVHAQTAAESAIISPNAATTAPRADEIVVLGSRIPRIKTEGPAPVTAITDKDILRSGFQSVPDVLRAITQNGGETQSQQSASGASFTPGAQQVDLRGLGPNHTLVLVNGRRIADFPLPFKGQSNFTDISNIPVGLIEKVEVLSGSASAIYGSDAIAGVVNFQLKRKAEGLTLDYRYGNTEHGGGASHRLTAVTGWDKGPFHGVVALEGLYQKPLWQYQREFQASTLNSPTNPLARRTFLRTDEYVNYLDPGAATCGALSGLNGGSTIYTSRARYAADGGPGYFCGSRNSISYGTMISERKSLNAYTSMGYDISDKVEAFADIQFSLSKLRVMSDVQKWYYVTPDGNEEGTFFNTLMSPADSDSGAQLDNWYRQFTPEEMGGLENGMTHNRSTTFNITTGLRGKLGKGDAWSWEVLFNHAQYNSTVSFPKVVIDKANAFYLGSRLGTDPASDYPMFAANVAKLYTPLTPAQYGSITAFSVYKPYSYTNNFSATINNPALLQLPAGPMGVALVAEAGGQGYNLRPDPLALGHYYVQWTDSDGSGSRGHLGIGYELRAPLLKILQVSTAGRYDRYHVTGSSFGKFTYNVGAELRPFRNLLIRGAMGTGFRAPDLHYVFSGNGDTHPEGVDYLTCRRADAAASYSDCADNNTVDMLSHRSGNRALRPETSRSINAGMVWQPTRNIDLSVDYFKVTLSNQVLDRSADSILRTEADCVLGVTPSGAAVNTSSPTCQDAIARVQRYTSGAFAGELQGVYVNPINVAREETDGVDVAMNAKFPTDRLGTFSFRLGYTYVFTHKFRQYEGDPTINKLAYDSSYDIPRDKGSASISWTNGPLTTTLQGQRLGKLPNYDMDRHLPATYLFNLSAQYDVNEKLRVSGSVTNLADTKPQYDASYSAYPYYDISWFDGVGRSFYLQLTYKLGAKTR